MYAAYIYWTIVVCLLKHRSCTSCTVAYHMIMSKTSSLFWPHLKWWPTFFLTDSHVYSAPLGLTITSKWFRRRMTSFCNSQWHSRRLPVKANWGFSGLLLVAAAVATKPLKPQLAFGGSYRWCRWPPPTAATQYRRLLPKLVICCWKHLLVNV